MRFVANFKTNHTRASTAEYIKTLSPILEEIGCKNTLIFPPATALQEGNSTIKVGAQNAYFTTNGAFTGELGLEQLDEFNIKTILIGHSERREILGESQEFIAKKFEFFANEGFEIIYCIGEPLEIREQGDEALFEYLFAQFEGIDTNYSKLTVAYEPIWAIGTGVSATIDDIKLVHNKLKEKLNLPLLYGGSVKVANIADIAQIDSVDGVLVGSASLDANEFAKLIKEGLGA
jgi:triosephosphate isomerase